MKNGESAEPSDPSRSRASEKLKLVDGLDGRWRVISLVSASDTFVVGSDSFVIAGLLPNVAATLDVSTGRAGSLVTVVSAVYACSALPSAGAGVVAVPICLSLPKSAARQTTDLVGVGRMLSEPRITAGLIRTLLIFSGVYLVCTYLSTIATLEAGASSRMTILLTAFGLSASPGESVAGRLATDPRRGRIVHCCLNPPLLTLPIICSGQRQLAHGPADATQ